mmetsp:Transcript_28037/g.50732  ORF Transcript_28037/g.50732 Transcript_28037/m.50732 type:complete len:81 (-) Transcript_28037:531-773(-)
MADTRNISGGGNSIVSNKMQARDMMCLSPHPLSNLTAATPELLRSFTDDGSPLHRHSYLHGNYRSQIGLPSKSESRKYTL